MRLVEVTRSVADGRGIFPFRFTPDPPDVPYPSVIIQVSPLDWTRLTANELDVPDGFDRLESLQER